MTMWTVIYGCIFFIILWVLTRITIWQLARWMKQKFNIDFAVKSIGLFSIKDIRIRINHFQAIEIDRVALHFKFLNRSKSRLVSLEFGEIRIRREIQKSVEPEVLTNSNTDSHQSVVNNSKKFYENGVWFLQFFFKHMSMSIDSLNIMVLHAFVPDSLLHINIEGIQLASDKSNVLETTSEIAPYLSLKSVEGKVLKSPKEAGEVTSCIAKVSTSLELVVLVSQLKPYLDVGVVNLDMNMLQIEIHEGALVPGILLPALKIGPLSIAATKPSVLSFENIQSHLETIISRLPSTSTFMIRSFGIAFFGDETMGETTRGAHVCSSKILLSQVKDVSNMVPVVLESSERNEFTVPHGYIRLSFEDVTMTDYYKHKVAYMGKTIIETKLTANGVLSNSLDLTAWHVDYIHKESVEFWSIIFKKIEDAEYQRLILEETLHHFPSQDNPNPSSNSNLRVRMSSASDAVSHPDILQGTESFSDVFVDQQKSSFSITQILKTIKINVIFECTVYDASIVLLMSPVSSTSDKDNPPSLTIGLDSFTGSVDQSPNSRDFNFMSKMEHFWCMVSRDNEVLAHGKEKLPEHSTAKSFHDVHLWGRAFNVESMGLYGSVSIKTPINSEQAQEISVLVDAKFAGVQVEVSGCAAEALASILVTVMPNSTDSDNSSSGRSPSMKKKTPGYESNASRKESSNYRWTLACLEVEMTRFNGFILSQDQTSFADYFVARIDKLKAELAGSDDTSSIDDDSCITRSVSILGFAVTTVHNPAFSPFASYDAGFNGSRTPASQLSPSLRLQQIKAPQYKCTPAAFMNPNHMQFDCFRIDYSINFDSNDRGSESELPRNPRERMRRRLVVDLSSESDILVRWSPALHALVHYGVVDFVSQLAPFFKRPVKDYKSTTAASVPQLNEPMANHGDYQMSRPRSRTSIELRMFGDGSSSTKSPVPIPLEVVVNLTTLKVGFRITEKQSLRVHCSPLSCVLSNNHTDITFDDLAIIMDDKQIFTFTKTSVELSPADNLCTQDRKTFSDLKTAYNRTWSFKFSTVKCNFPHKYDFAATFDQCVTTFKWVKGLYKKTSHPFRSNRLPPDLVICIDQFTFEISDWDFESHLRDNHELMKDEWSESEKRRHVLDQRMGELRKQRGEMLPAKKVEELYCRLEEECTKIYLSRCQDLYDFCCRPVFLMPHHQTSATFIPSRRPSLRGQDSCQSPTCLEKQLRTDKLFCWTLVGFKASVLADESMHGMKNAIKTIRNIDHESPFPFKNDQDEDPDFVTLWCRVISLSASKHQIRLRNFPQCLMDYTDWTIRGKLCGAEQKGSPISKRTEYVHLPSPWGPAKILRNMPALKFYHDLISDVHTFNMAWGPCWDPVWSQVNLALNLMTKTTIDPSPPLPWWDKSRMLFHGKLEMTMARANLLHLASLDPYNTTEHMHWDWKNLYMLWTPGLFLFKGDLDIHIRNASKYDDIRFLHLPHLKMTCDFEWICLDGADPHNHHGATPCAPDKLEANELEGHDSYRLFRSRNIDLSIDLDTRCHNVDAVRTDLDYSSSEERDKPEILLYSTTLRWLSNFWYAINAVARPICKGPLFNNVSPPKLKLSRHYRNVKLSFQFPELKACYWASYAQQLGLEWLCGAGKVTSHFRLQIMPHEGELIRRSMGQWSVISTQCELKKTKIYLMKRKDIDEVATQSPSTRSLGAERNFMLSLSLMSYHRSVSDSDSSPVKSREMKRTSSTLSRSSINEYDEVKYRKKRPKKVSSPTKKPQNRQTLVVHDLRAMWTTDNRDVVYGLYEGYSKAAVLRRNLNTKIMSKFRIGASRDENEADSSQSRKHTPTPSSDFGSFPNVSQRTMDPSEMLQQLLSEPANKMVVGIEETSSEKPTLKGVAASCTDDVVNENWLIKFVNCQAMLKGPKTQGYIILTAAQADFLNRDYKVTWRDDQLTTKASWVGSLTGTQIFATVEKNVTSSGQDGENVPWLSVSDIAPRGPSPGMLDITDLMGGGQAVGGVVGDGVSAGSFQLQRIVSRCTCKMFYVGYESLVDSEQSDYAHLLPDTPLSPEDEKLPGGRNRLAGGDLMMNEKPSNILTVLQPELEICTNHSQFTMILDIVENLLLYVEPVMREYWERVERMRFKLRLTSADDALKHRDTLAAMQSRIRTQLTNMRQLERQLFRTDQALDNDPSNADLLEECTELRQRLAEDKETLNSHSEELGIIIRCFKELFLEQKTRSSSLRAQSRYEAQEDEEEASVARTTEVSLGRVKWNLTDEDGQLNLAQFEMKDFLYDKVNRSDDSVSHSFEVAWLRVQNLLPNSIYRDVIKPRSPGLRNCGVSGAGGQPLSLRVLCKVRPPVGGISVKDHVEVNAAPLSIQLTYQFFKRMMLFFFPDKGSSSSNPEDDDISITGSIDSRDIRGATVLGLQANSTLQDHRASIRSLPVRPPPPSPSSLSGTHRRTRSSAKRDRAGNDAVDDVEKMKERAAKNNSFLYIKITQVPLCVSYKGEKEKNMADVHEFDVTIPMLEYHSMTWTWHDFALAVKRDCKKHLLSQVIKKKFLFSDRTSSPSSLKSSSSDLSGESAQTSESNKARLLLGNTLQRSESTKKSFLSRKKK